MNGANGTTFSISGTAVVNGELTLNGCPLLRPHAVFVVHSSTNGMCNALRIAPLSILQISPIVRANVTVPVVVLHEAALVITGPSVLSGVLQVDFNGSVTVSNRDKDGFPPNV